MRRKLDLAVFLPLPDTSVDKCNIRFDSNEDGPVDEIQRQGPTGWQFVRQYFGRIVIGVILGGMAFSAMTVVLLKWRDSVAVDQCLQNTKRIGIAFYNYLDTYKCLPEVEAGE